MEYSTAIRSSDERFWVDRIPALDSNYIWSVNHAAYDTCLIVDPGDAAPVINYLERAERLLGAILITHRHQDHIGGLSALRDAYPGVPIYGPDHENINADVIVCESARETQSSDAKRSTLRFFGDELTFKILHLPGHLEEHVAYYCDAPESPWVFSGDIVFSAGCGRNFEGHPHELHDSIKRLAELDDKTVLFSVHEYTQANLNFARSVDPTNDSIAFYKTRVDLLRAQQAATSPTTVGLEKIINPFFRCHHNEVQSAVAQAARLSVENAQECFVTMRRLKDRFRA